MIQTKYEEIETRFGKEGLYLLEDDSVPAEVIARFFESKGLALSPSTVRFYRRDAKARVTDR